MQYITEQCTDSLLYLLLLWLHHTFLVNSLEIYWSRICRQLLSMIRTTQWKLWSYFWGSTFYSHAFRGLVSSNMWAIYSHCQHRAHLGRTGPTWVLSTPGGPHVGPMNRALKVVAGLLLLDYINSYLLSFVMIMWLRVLCSILFGLYEVAQGRKGVWATDKYRKYMENK